uniref:BspA family leucine-rich repeat surface protein n=1 Tax=Amphora coffeiformis TaxID=265554 RepID=A0A7S3KZN0_9STRA
MTTTGKDNSQDVSSTGAPDVEQCHFSIDNGSTPTDPSKKRIKPCIEVALLFALVCAAALVGGLVFGKDSSGSSADNAESNGSQDGNGYKCFESRDEVFWAVKGYMDPNNRADTVALYGPIRHWCVGQVTDFTAVFRDQKDFNEPLDWDVSQATTLREMFSGATSFNQNLDWDVSQVQDMSFAFYNADSFNGDISGWDVSQVTDMHLMFAHAESFNGDLSGWVVSKVTNMLGMFNNCVSFEQNLCNWGDLLPSNVGIDYAFASSGCVITGTPDIHASPPGPFCQICE